jgi:hypothetical protein
MNQNQIFTLLSKIIKKEYLGKYKDWYQTATLNEKKGISIIKFIIETRGHQKADQTVIEREKNVQELLNEPFW